MFLFEGHRIGAVAAARGAPENANDALVETYSGAWGLFGGDVLHPLQKAQEVKALEPQTGQSMC